MWLKMDVFISVSKIFKHCLHLDGLCLMFFFTISLIISVEEIDENY